MENFCNITLPFDQLMHPLWINVNLKKKTVYKMYLDTLQRGPKAPFYSVGDTAVSQLLSL